MTHDAVELAKQLVEESHIHPLAFDARPALIRLFNESGFDFIDSMEMAGIVIDDAQRVQQSIQEWHAAERRYAQLDRQHEIHLDGVPIRRGI